MIRQTFEDNYCVRFQEIPIRGFRFIVLTYTPMDRVITFDETHGCHGIMAHSLMSKHSNTCTNSGLQVNGGINEDVEVEPALAVARDRQSMAEV